ncbi:hypothetical protein [Gordonia alkanivorans]|uniref:hypothetical protein n=1 Tax=Gordonia alkanivorans TaxID=84096 RepID=UPI0024B63B7A|nr:hypothetical protein [Gordonia alkanivorans]MDJ0010100.1 hypothetical protein [Gordonia alkanivorans]MDJ0495710.1 hypothetical protein [Gordonia alkanivorans]
MIPALFDVEHLVFDEAAGEDVYGDQVAGFLPAVSKKFVTYNSPRTTEPKLVTSDRGNTRDVVELEMIVLPDFGPVSAKDQMVIDGKEYEVIGEVEDYTKNPFNSEFGCFVVNLKKVSG